MTMLSRGTASSLVAQAPAKLNLFLRVVGKRTDGYHDIETVMTTVDLYDTLVFRPACDNRVELTVQIAGKENTDGGRPESSASIPTGQQNLVYRAAMLLKERGNVGWGAQITLIKRIPSAAGLGGGSSDAAATLDGLNRFWSLGLSREDLRDLASQIGSDVPFFLGPTSIAVCRGRGELIEPLTARSAMVFVVAKPASGLSTPAVYRNCRPEPEGSGITPLCRSLRQGRWDEVARHLRNDLQSPAKGLNSDLVRLSCLFDEQPVRGHQLSGSGTAYFGLCDSRSQALAVAARLRRRGVPWVTVVQSRC
jgi:4-diphosphocytidyl-2-C-methyl-D-erythritol kinase